MSNDKKKQPISIYVPENLRSGVFSNIANIHISKDGHTVIIDFIFSSPEELNLVSRIILSVDHAKSLQEVLSGLLKSKK